MGIDIQMMNSGYGALGLLLAVAVGVSSSWSP